MLPYAAEAYLALLAEYQRAIWPAPLLTLALGVVALVHVLRPLPGGDRLVAGVLAAAWVWTGAVFYLGHLARLDFAAPAYAALFLAEGTLLGWAGVVRGRLAFRLRRDAFGWVGLALAALGLGAAPLIARLAAGDWARAAWFGVSPEPTLVVTLGLLLLAPGRTPLALVVPPALAALLGGATAWLLDLPQGLAYAAAGLAGGALILAKNRRGRGG